MNSNELRKKFIDFFKSKGHAVVPSSSLIPDDPSVLLTTAGMQQFKRYFMGELNFEKDYPDKIGAVSVQKCFRTSDIDEVGDESHNTFFEMLGNFSFGGYFKKEAIEYAYEFIKELGLQVDYVTVFKGDPSTGSGQAVTVDEESEKSWQELGIKDIIKMNREENFWGPTGSEGPCGPTTEIYVKGVTAEVWNLVFNEYYSKDGKLSPLKVKGVDTGMGLERLATAVQGKKNIFETDLFTPLISILSGPIGPLSEETKRMIADHCRAITFLVSDGVRPSNKLAGYVPRRLMRRVIARSEDSAIGFEWKVIEDLIRSIVKDYSGFYPELNSDLVLSEFNNERERFLKTLQAGLRELSKLKDLDAKTAFKLYETYGLPFEVMIDLEIAGSKAFNLSREAFDKEFAKHQEKSRAGAEKKFGKQ